MSFFLMFTIATIAQEKNNEIALITETIENYFNGYMQSDEDMIEK